MEILPYQNEHQSSRIAMMEAIAKEFEFPIFNREQLRTPLLDCFWVAVDQGVVIGTIGVLKIGKDQAVLKSMFVSKAYRGGALGISTLLMTTVFDWCLEREVSQLFLGTMNQFMAAHKFYEKNGFEQIKKEVLPVGFLVNPVDDMFYVKKLM